MVTGSTGTSRRHELDQLELPEVKAEISAWLTELLGRQGADLSEETMADAVDDLFRRFGKAFNRAD